jgi:uncharacterized repeat protein (TIGR03803 family)
MTSTRARRFCGWLLLTAVATFGGTVVAANSIPLYSFSGDDGANPHGTLVQGSDGNFYGTTSFGGASNDGTVFQITPAGSLTTLYSFSGGDGSHPFAGLVQGGDGDFYGTTFRGGAGNSGTVFKLSPAVAPTNTDQCKGGGWATFTSPRAFKNQGDCIQFVNTGR